MAFASVVLACQILSVFLIVASLAEDDSSGGFCDKDGGCGDGGGAPNVVILLADDLGYGDLACYGHPMQTPNRIDQMAAEGRRFTQFYAADSMCTPSRAGLLTGRLPIRSGMVGGRRVLMDFDTGGLPRNETTVAELLAAAGYYTGMVGKWHLGINAVDTTDGTHLPSRRGFQYVGTNLPLSVLWECDESGFFEPRGPSNSCFLYKGDKLVQQPIRFDTLTADLVADWRHFLARAVRKQTNAARQPFFFYFSFPHVHATQFASEQFKGTSKRGLYGDNIAEMAWAVGEVLDSLKDTGVDRETLVLFLSDHGPHKELCLAGGSTAGLKGGKGNAFEGGFRVPAIAWQPGTIAAGGVSDAVLSALDLLPTLSQLGAGRPPAVGRAYDGVDVSAQLLGRHSLLDHTAGRPIFFYCNRNLLAMRLRQYKLHYFTPKIFTFVDAREWCPEGIPQKDWYVDQLCPLDKLTQHDPPLVFDLDTDPFEAFPLNATMFEELIDEAEDVVERHRDSIKSVPDQLGHFTTKVIPCCGGKECRCNYD